MNLEDLLISLLIGILGNLIAEFLWPRINNNFVKNNKRNNEISLVDVSNIKEEKSRYNIFHGNTPLTYSGNGKFDAILYHFLVIFELLVAHHG